MDRRLLPWIGAVVVAGIGCGAAFVWRVNDPSHESHYTLVVSVVALIAAIVALVYCAVVGWKDDGPSASEETTTQLVATGPGSSGSAIQLQNVTARTLVISTGADASFQFISDATEVATGEFSSGIVAREFDVLANPSVTERSGGVDFADEIQLARKHIDDRQPAVAISILQLLLSKQPSQHALYRIHANLGIAFQNQHDFKNASKHLFSASYAKPDEAGALALRAMALLLSGQRQQAFELAQSITSENPSEARGWTALIRSAALETSLESLEALLPAPLRETEEILHALAWAAYERGNGTRAEEISRHAMSLGYEMHSFQELLALSLMNQATTRRRLTKRATHDGLNLLLQEAIALFDALLNDEASLPSSERFRHRYNRGIAKFIADRKDDAENDLSFALQLDPQSWDARFALARVLAATDQLDKTSVVLSRGDAATKPPAAAILEARLLTRVKTDTALASARKLLADVEDCDEKDPALWIDWLDTHARCNELQGHPEWSLNQIETARNRSRISKSVAYAMESRLAALAEDEARSDSLSRLAVAEAIASDSPIEKTVVTEILANQGRFAAAVEVFKSLQAQDLDSEDIVRALRCAMEAGEFDYIFALTSDLRERRIDLDQAIDVELIVLAAYGEYETAISRIQDYLTRTESDGFRRYLHFRLSQISVLAGREDLVTYDSALLPRVEEVHPRLGHEVVRHLRSGPNPWDAAQYAYALVKQNPQSADAHKALIAATNLFSDGGTSVKTLESVGAGCGVQFIESGAKEKQWLILVDEPPADSSRGEYGPTSSFWKNLAGKRVGETFVLRDDPGQPRHATVEAIVPKELARAVMSFRAWELLFPDDPLVRTYSFANTDDGSFDASKLISVLDKFEEQQNYVFDIYRRQVPSVSWLAQIQERTVLEAMQGVIGKPGLPIRYCEGTEEEYIRARRALQREGEAKVVIDASALATLYMSGFFKKIKSSPLRLMTSRNTMNAVRVGIQSQPSQHGRKRFGKVGDRFIFHEFSDDEIASVEERSKSFLTWLSETVEIVNGLPAARLRPEIRRPIEEAFGLPAVECIAAAAEHDAMLWTDDRLCAQVISEAIAVRRVWSQAVADHLAEVRAVESAAADDLTIFFVTCDYVFTRVNVRVLTSAIRRAGWNPEEYPFVAFSDYLRTPGLLGRGAAIVVAGTLASVWSSAPLHEQRRALTEKLTIDIASIERGSGLLPLLLKAVQEIFGEKGIDATECLQIVKDVRDRSTRRIEIGRTYRPRRSDEP